MIKFDNYIENSAKFNITKEGYVVCSERIVDHTEMLHHCIGIVTENGELLDALKKSIYYGKELDIVNVVEEVGDIFWYASQLIQLVSNQTGIPVQTILTLNTQKLAARYPDKFTEKSAQERDLDKERSILEEGASN